MASGTSIPMGDRFFLPFVAQRLSVEDDYDWRDSVRHRDGRSALGQANLLPIG